MRAAQRHIVTKSETCVSFTKSVRMQMWAKQRTNEHGEVWLAYANNAEPKVFAPGVVEGRQEAAHAIERETGTTNAERKTLFTPFMEHVAPAAGKSSRSFLPSTTSTTTDLEGGETTILPFSQKDFGPINIEYSVSTATWVENAPATDNAHMKQTPK